MKFEVQSQGRFLGFHTQRVQHPQQGFDGRVMVRVSLFAQPVPAWPLEGQGNSFAPGFNRTQHVPGLIPIAIEQQHLHVLRAGQWRDGGFQRSAARMKDPELAARKSNGLRVGILSALMDEGTRAVHGALDQPPGTGRAPQLALVNEDIDLKPGVHRRDTAANTPARWEQTSLTPLRAGANDTA